MITEKVEQARDLLTRLGMDEIRSNERSARTLLALLRLKPADPWSSAANPMLGIDAIRDWIGEHYGFTYATGSRETIRKQTLHQFIEALLITENPDRPDRPINSPQWNYQITTEALAIIQMYGSPEFETALARYLAIVPGLKKRYAAARALNRIPVTVPGGKPFQLSPGGQNVLIKQIIEEFCPRFTPGGELLYVGDADDKWALFEADRLAGLGVTVNQHGKMPDVVVYLPGKDWLVLMEAASSHGPVDFSRRGELAGLFSNANPGLVYVSCFPDRRTMRRYLNEIAWETDAWCAEDPTHMIHFNGERFLGPYG